MGPGKRQVGIRAKVEHPVRVIKRQFGLVKVSYRGLKKNTAQLYTQFPLFHSKICDADTSSSRWQTFRPVQSFEFMLEQAWRSVFVPCAGTVAPGLQTQEPAAYLNKLGVGGGRNGLQKRGHLAGWRIGR